MRNIRKFRGMVGLTQTELANKIGKARAWVNYLENNDSCVRITDETRDKLCEALDCSIIQLYGFDNFIYKPQNDKDIYDLILMLLSTAKDKAEIIDKVERYEFS